MTRIASFQQVPADLKAKEGVSCLLPISVGQGYHEGEKFEATIQLINKKFSKCHIVIADTLQRHTTLIHAPNSLTSKEIEKQSIQRGLEWRERNSPYLESLSMPVTITHWNEWRYHEKYQEYKILIETMYSKNIPFRESFESTAYLFMKRFQEKFQIQEDQVYSHVLSYLIEECAILPIWFEASCDYLVYPTPLTPALCTTLETFQEKENTKLLEPLALRFKKKKGQLTTARSLRA